MLAPSITKTMMSVTMKKIDPDKKNYNDILVVSCKYYTERQFNSDAQLKDVGISVLQS